MTWKDDADFERKLTESLGDVIPGEDSLQSINPWHIPISYITWGLILTLFQLNFAYLQYILPVVGNALLYVGFRSLRKENGYFAVAWAISGVRLLMQLVFLVGDVTPWFPWLKDNWLLSACSFALQIALFLAFRAALNEVHRKAGVGQEGDPLLRAVIWLILMGLCALSPLSGSWLAFIPLFIFFIFVVRAIYRVGGELGDAGYCLTLAPVEVSGRLVIGAYIAFCFLLALGCSAVASHATPEFAQRPAITESDTRERLRTMGFPADILDDVSDENVELLKDAVRIEASDEVLELRDQLETTVVYVQTPGNVMWALEYFAWITGGAYWNDGFSIWATGNMELREGLLLYSTDGAEYAAPIPRLFSGSATQNSVFFGTQTNPVITGGVCYPFGAKEQRGYILYRMEFDYTWVNGNTCLNYAHAVSPITLPFQTAEQKILSGTTEFRQHVGMFQLLPPDQLE